MDESVLFILKYWCIVKSCKTPRSVLLKIYDLIIFHKSSTRHKTAPKHQWSIIPYYRTALYCKLHFVVSYSKQPIHTAVLPACLCWSHVYVEPHVGLHLSLFMPTFAGKQYQGNVTLFLSFLVENVFLESLNILNFSKLWSVQITTLYSVLMIMWKCWSIANILIAGIKSWEVHTKLFRFYTPLGRLAALLNWLLTQGTITVSTELHQIIHLKDIGFFFFKLIHNILPWALNLWAWSQLQSAFQWLPAEASGFLVLQQWHL